MTEQQLREKLQFAYGNMPDATRAAFEHSRRTTVRRKHTETSA